MEGDTCRAPFIHCRTVISFTFIKEHPDTTMISGMESLLKNARICREIIRSQPNRPYEHYWKEFLKTQQARNALLGDSGSRDRREE